MDSWSCQSSRVLGVGKESVHVLLLFRLALHCLFTSFPYQPQRYSSREKIQSFLRAGPLTVHEGGSTMETSFPS